MPANTDVTLRIVNEGVAVHNMSIAGSGVTTPTMLTGETYEIALNLPPGDYAIVCDIPGHKIAGMTGVIHVVE